MVFFGSVTLSPAVPVIIVESPAAGYVELALPAVQYAPYL